MSRTSIDPLVLEAGLTSRPVTLGQGWTYLVPIRWSKDNWSRFRAAAYARNLSAAEYARLLLEQAATEHERMGSHD